MKKTGRRVTSVVLSVLMILSMLVVGMASGVAAGTTTLYYCPKQAWLDAGYTVRANACVSNGENKWTHVEMTDTGETVNGAPVYSAVFDNSTVPYGGFDKLQFQAYQGSTWKEQVVPIDGWKTLSAINGKFYDGSAWADYTPDAAEPTGTLPTEAPTTVPTEAPTQAYAPTTLYFCPTQDWLDAGYTIKVNACGSQNDNIWTQLAMTKTDDTFGGKDVYTVSLEASATPYGGFDKLQFQAYDGDTWKEQVVAIDGWMTVDAVDGKLYDGESWVEYVPGGTEPTDPTELPTAAPTEAPTVAPTEPLPPTTLYFCPAQDWLDAGYTIKVNACGSKNDNIWTQLTMTKTGETFGGVAVYTVSLEASVTPYGGFDKLQFQAYDGDTWKAQVVAIDGWMTVDTVDGKLYDGENWVEYVPGGTEPTDVPTEVPTTAPTQAPTLAPTEAPTTIPTEAPTVAPTEPLPPTTLYFCPAQDWLDAGYTIKANACGSKNDNIWTQLTMTKTGETFGGKDVYTVSLEASATPYGGFDKLQFQAYEGDTWKAQVVAIDAWMTVDAVDGKLYDGENWVDYVPGGTEPTDAPTEMPTTAPTQAPTTEPTEVPTEQPTKPPVERYMLGDVNGDGEITLADVLAMQNYLAAKVLFTDRQLLIGDVDRSGKIDIVDILEMQKYLALMPTNCEIGKYFGGTQEPSDPESQTVTLYFSNGVFWDEVYAYAWRASDENKNQEWPGEQLVSLGKNDFGEDIYSVTLDLSEYDNIVFSNGSGQQTQDIALSEVEDSMGIYCDKSSQDDLGHYAYGTYQFDPSIIV